ncbi:MAG: RNA 2',3'-cyclic phosphodiesterase [Gammaproteobacteria bacterium]
MLDNSADKMRLFLAAWPTDEVRRYISDDTEAAVIESGGRPVPAKNFHITLAFLGDVRQSGLDDIVKAMRSVRFGRFDLRLDRLGYWPNSKIAWLSPSKKHIALEALVEDIWNKLEMLGFMREYGDYKAHVSLCRNAKAGLNTSLPDPIFWTVNAFALVSSVPGKSGSDYTLLEQFHAGN